MLSLYFNCQAVFNPSSTPCLQWAKWFILPLGISISDLTLPAVLSGLWRYEITKSQAGYKDSSSVIKGRGWHFSSRKKEAQAVKGNEFHLYPHPDSCVRLLLFSYSVMSNSFRPQGLQHARLPVLHLLLEFAQTHVHRVGDANQPSHPLLSPSPPAFNLSQHQGLFRHQVAKVLEFQHQPFQ